MLRLLNQILLKGVSVSVIIGAMFALLFSVRTFISAFSAANIGQGSLLVAASIVLFVVSFCLVMLFFHTYISISYNEKVIDSEMTKEKEFETGEMKSLFERESLLFNIEKQAESCSETNITYSLLDDNGNELKKESIKIEKSLVFEMKNLKRDDFQKIRKIRIVDDEGLNYKVTIIFSAFNGK